MKLYRLTLLCLSLPVLSWGACEWTNPTDGNWSDTGNWDTCNSSYPGNTGSSPDVLLSKPGLSNITISLDVPADDFPVYLNSLTLAILSGSETNYRIIPSGGRLRMSENSVISTGGSVPSDLVIATPTQFQFLPLNTIKYQPLNGSITIETLSVNSSHVNLHIIYGDNSAPLTPLSPLINKSNVIGIFANKLSLNPTSAQNGQFQNLNTLFVSGITIGSIVEVTTLEISRSFLTSEPDFDNNNTGIVELEAKGARTQAVNLTLTEGQTPFLRVVNTADVSNPISIGSVVDIGSITGNSMALEILNQQSSGVFHEIDDGAIGALFDITGTAETVWDANSRFVLFNENKVFDLGSIGSCLSSNGPITQAGMLSLTNEGEITGGGAGVNFDCTVLTNQGNGSMKLSNHGTIVNAIGVKMPIGDFFMNGGDCQLESTGEVISGGRGVMLEVANYQQTSGSMVVKASPVGSFDDSSFGSLLQVTNSMNVFGGTLENNEYVLIGDQLLIMNSGVVKGTGTFAAIDSTPGTLLPLLGGIGIGVVNSGTISPGNSPGVLHMVGNYLQTTGGALEIHILNASGPGPNGYSQLELTGAATLGGTVRFVLDEGAQVNCNDTFLFLTADSITGEFANLSDNFPENFSPCLIYEDQAVRMILRCVDPCPCPCPCPCLCDYIGNFTQTLFASITETNNFFIKRQLQRVQERVMKPKESTKGNVYFGPIGSVGTSEQACNQVGFDYWSAGVVAGADYAFAQGGVGGLVLYEDIESDDENFGWGSFRTQRAHASVYGSYVPEQVKEVSIDLMVGGGYDWYRIERNSKTGSPNGYEFDTMISFEYMYTQGNYHVVPMVNLQYAYLKVDDYSEDCGGICFDDQRAKSLSTVLGVWGDYTWKPVTLQANIGWQREYLNNDRTLSFTGGCMNLEGAQRNNLLAGLNVLWQIREVWSVEASYDLIWNNQFDRNGFYLGVNRAF